MTIRAKSCIYTLLALLATAFLLLHTPPVRRAVRNLLTVWLSSRLGGTVEMEALDYQLWRGQINIRGLHVEPAPDRYPFVLTSEQILIHWTPWKASIRALQPHLTVLETGRMKPESGKPAGLQIPTPVADLDIEGGSLVIAQKSQEPWLELTSLNAHLAVVGRRSQGEIHSASGRLSSISVGPLDARFEIEDKRIHLKETILRKEDSRIQARGTITSLSPLSAAIDIDFDLDGNVIDELKPEWDLAGNVTGRATLRADSGDIRLDGELDSSHLHSSHFGSWALGGEASFANNIVDVRSVTLNGYEGTVQAQGRFDLEQQTQSLKVSLTDLDLASLGSIWTGQPVPLASRVSGSLEIDLDGWNLVSAEGRGRIELQRSSSRPGLPVSGVVALVARAGAIQLEAPRIQVPEGEIALAGNLQKDARWNLSTSAHLEELRRLEPLLTGLVGGMLPEGLSGELSFQGLASGSLDKPSSLSANLEIKSEKLKVLGEPLRGDAHLAIADQRIDVQGIHLFLLERQGKMTALGSISLASGGLNIHGQTEGFDFSGIAQDFGLPVEGLAAGSFEVTGALEDPDVLVTVLLSRLRMGDVAGETSFTVRKQGRTIELEELDAKLGDATGSARGRINLDSQELDIRIQAQQIPLQTVLPDDSRGHWFDGVVSSLQAEITGTPTAPRGHARLRLEEIALREIPLPSLEIEARSDGETFRALATRLDGGPFLASECTLEGDYPCHGSLHLDALPLDSMLRAFFPSTPEDTRLLVQGRLEFSAPLLRPEEVRYELRVDQMAGRYGGIGGGTGSPFTVEGDRTLVRVSELHLVGTDTAIEVDGSIPLTAAATFDLRLKGSTRLELFNPRLEQMELAGEASLDLEVTGSLSRPVVAGDVRVENASVSWKEIRAEGMTLVLTAGENTIRLQELSGNLLGGTFQVAGELPLPHPRVEQPAHLDFVLDEFDLAEAVPADYRISPHPTLRVSATGSLEAPRLETSSLRGRGELSMIRVGFENMEVVNDGPSPWSLEDSRLVASRLHLTGANTDLEVGLELGWTEEPRWKASLSGRLDNTFLHPMLRAAGDAILTGTTDIRLTLDGSPSGPILNGTGSLNGAELVLREPPLVFTNLAGEVEADGQRVELTRLTAEAGGGSVKGKGDLTLSGWTDLGGLNFQMDIDTVRLDYPNGLRSEVSGSLRLSGSSEDLLLSGDLRLLRSSFSRNITLESELMSSLEREAELFSEEEDFAERMRLELNVSTVDDLRIDNNMAKVDSAANFKVTGTLAAPLLDGLLRARPQGTFRLGRNEYEIDSGSILLRGYPAEPPDLDLTARTMVSGVEIVLELRGRPDDLSMELRASDRPELTRGDIASLLVTGRTLENVSDFDTVSGQERQILGEQLATYLGGTLANLAQQGLGEAFRFDQISVMPSQLGSEVSPELRFTLGKAITDELFLTYSIGLENTEKQLWILDYRLPRRLTLRATRQEDNTFSGTVSQKLLFDLPGNPRPNPLKPPARRVSSVRVEGAPPPWEEQLSKTVRVSAKDKYDYWKAQEDAERLKREARDKGFWGATVDVTTQSLGENGIALTYRIDLGKPIDVHWEGDDPGQAIRALIRREWDGRVPESFLLVDLASRAKHELQRSRFYRAEVFASADEAPDGSRVVTFTVKKGPLGRGVSLQFEGNLALTDRELRAALPSTSSSEFFLLLDQDDDRLGRRLRAAYVSIGLLEARVGQPRVDYLLEEGELRVSIPINEGPQPVVTEVALVGVESLPEPDLRRDLQMTVGFPFRLADYQQDRSTLTSVYREAGFPEVRARGRLERLDSGLRVVYEIREGRRIRVGNVKVVGNYSTDESLILREKTFESGQPLRLSQLTETQRRLYELGIFRSADVRMGPAVEQSIERDVLIDVAESSDLDFNYGLRFSSENEVDILTELRMPNLFGRAHQGGITARFSGEKNLLRGTYHIPYFWNHRLATDLIASRETDEDQFFRQTFWSFTFQQRRELKEKLDVQWSYTYKRTHTLGKITEDNPFPFDFLIDQSILTASLIEDLRDNLIRPSRGRFWSLTFQFAPEALGSDVKFIKLFGQLFYFHSLGSNLVWASSYRMGVAGGFDQMLLPDDRFRGGGATTVRGFEEDSLGPLDPITGTVIGGGAVVIYNQELRFPLYRWFRGVAFYDAGNVFLEANDLRPFDLRHSAGAGLRWVLPFGLLRFDYAWVLDQQPGEEGSRFWFSLNHAF